MKCIGFGEYENKCNNLAGSTHSEHWCQRCDDIRRKHITKSLEDMVGGTHMLMKETIRVLKEELAKETKTFEFTYNHYVQKGKECPQKVKDDFKNKKDSFITAIKLLEDYEGVKGFPEKRETGHSLHGPIYAGIIQKNEGFNEATHICRIAYLKAMDNLEQTISNFFAGKTEDYIARPGLWIDDLAKRIRGGE